ncbi:MAG: class II glutamine amidotransferase, partial [Candidatus Heimdallarchaeota archaeon]|nr:class II glutamine amidotransferase [Candidatus Heimdallarchaeota archaeon]
YLGAAREAPEYKEKVQSFQIQPHTFLCHLRKASPSIPISLPNCHPFLSAGWAFIHNGTVYTTENLEKASMFQMSSDNSDSEFLFHYLLRYILEEERIEHRIERLIGSLLKINLKFSSLNSMISNGSEMYVIRYAADHRDYFTLFYNETGSGVIVSSEPIGAQEVREENWAEMPNRSVLSISSDPLEVKLTRF